LPTFAFIESNTTGTGHLLARKAAARGFRVLFLCRDPHRYPWLADELVHPVIIDTEDHGAMIARLGNEPDLAAVLSSSEYFLEAAAVVADALGLVGSDPAAVAACRDKGRAVDILGQAGVSVPASVIVDRGSGTEPPIPLPVVVKPISGSGSIGVKLCRTETEYGDHLNGLLSKTTNERGIPVEPKALVQELVEGPELSVEALGSGSEIAIMGITAKHLGAPPFFLEVGHDFPAALDETTRSAVEDEVVRALRAIGLTLGPSHTELRLRDGKPYLIEINPRLAGGMIPVLIEAAHGFDPLELVLDAALGKSARPNPSRDDTASIRFLIPKQAGNLGEVETPDPIEGLHELAITKPAGYAVGLYGDFRDRIGHLITIGASAEESRARAETMLAATEIRITAGVPAAKGDTGRIKKTLHPEALRIVRTPPPPEARIADLEMLTRIDEAHLLMLHARKILPEATIRAVLGEVRRLREEGFAELRDSVAPRGTYLLYEDYLINRLGGEVAGAVHTGRSRNDINATTHLIDLRDASLALMSKLWRLRSTILLRARRDESLAMPVYSQFQPGMPGTLGFYLTGQEEALSRDARGLFAVVEEMTACPMGAGAGAGTSVPIDAELTARLLGFERARNHALDAVATRDIALRLLSAAAICGTTVSRLAEDFQLWTTREFAFFELPDDLAGGSSMMPQKKNPYLLEIIKGKTLRLQGRLMSAMTTMARVPFGNSLQVGTEALTDVGRAIAELGDAVDLMRLIVSGAIARPDAMARSAREGLVVATLITEELVTEAGLPFREAHHRVGACITEALDSGRDAREAVLALLPGRAEVTDAEWAARSRYGGGPGATTAIRECAEARLVDDGDRLRGIRTLLHAAEEERARRVDALL